MAATAADSFSSLSGGLGNYDVFLSFRGFDTRKIFVGHLYHALQRRALSAFIDSEELGKGDVLGVLLKAIDASKLSVVVLSENYAYSTWCLKELARIVECMETKNHKVVPIFYQVDIADVKHVRGIFQRAFAEHEFKSRGTMEERERWRSALTRVSNISGWDSHKYQDDAKLVEHIAEDIFEKLIKANSSQSN